ncbi:hypothetical protein E2986_09345 [Frieseomelitta varia]|uniref:UDP-glucuronosyltransferase n=1 Tax=Frieseomelitta varia TaxID=561572 RepID=A0A833VS83_9HYME|nr:hypothetical protein E2986_09345 [Frieseomelitta varia]
MLVKLKMANSIDGVVIPFVILLLCNSTTGYNILLATMGGTKSHTVPFVALGSSLKARGHNVTLLSAFPGPAANNGLQEFVPPIFECSGRNMSRLIVIEPIIIIPLYTQHKTKHDNGQTILNTQVALYSGSISRQGNPSPWSVTPYFGKSLTQDMNFLQRLLNAACLATLRLMHWIMINGYLQPVLRKYLGDQLPDVRDLTTEIPLTLQNSHYSVADSVPYLANVVNVACLHCKPATNLGPDLESFLQRGFIFVSMGSSVRASDMPEALRQIFVAVFATLPCNVVWKWEGMKIKDLPSNVRTAAWWPQQELLGHPKLRAFVSHGGLLSLHEAAYHAAPTLVLPVFCDHDGNAAQAEKLGYALVMDLSRISIGSFRDGILKVAAVHNNSYRTAAKKRSSLLRDLPINPRKLATWWVEHVAKYKGAEHLKSSARIKCNNHSMKLICFRYMNVVHYYSIDVAIFYVIALILLVCGLKKLCWRTIFKQVVKKKID